MGIFDKNPTVLPYDYPELLKFKEAIRHSYWIDTEYNFTDDVQDYRVNISDSERESIKRTMFAIAQIEVNVKDFWGDIHKRLPKTSIKAVGATFNESEVRHFDAYKRLLEILNLEEIFTTVNEIPAIQKRVAYLNKYLDGTKSIDDREFTRSVLLFSLFIEHVSLFSQFLIMMSFNKGDGDRKLFKGISNVVEATSKEEQIHGDFGTEIINIILSENSEWRTEAFETQIKNDCLQAYDAEMGIIDWIFEEGELFFLPKKVIFEFIKNRFNNSLASIGISPLFEIDEELLEETKWFDVELKTTKEGDFFYKKQIDYNKKSKSITEDDLF